MTGHDVSWPVKIGKHNHRFTCTILCEKQITAMPWLSDMQLLLCHLGPWATGRGALRCAGGNAMAISDRLSYWATACGLLQESVASAMIGRGIRFMTRLDTS